MFLTFDSDFVSIIIYNYSIRYQIWCDKRTAIIEPVLRSVIGIGYTYSMREKFSNISQRNCTAKTRSLGIWLPFPNWSIKASVNGAQFQFWKTIFTAKPTCSLKFYKSFKIYCFRRNWLQSILYTAEYSFWWWIKNSQKMFWLLFPTHNIWKLYKLWIFKYEYTVMYSEGKNGRDK